MEAARQNAGGVLGVDADHILEVEPDHILEVEADRILEGHLRTLAEEVAGHSQVGVGLGHTVVAGVVDHRSRNQGRHHMEHLQVEEGHQIQLVGDHLLKGEK
jgi:hypothetical protein